MSKETQNHYLAGRQAWAEVFGSFIQERNLWRLVALLVSIVAILLGAGNRITSYNVCYTKLLRDVMACNTAAATSTDEM